MNSTPAGPATLAFLSAGAAQGIFAALADEFRQSTGASLQGHFGAVGAMLERFQAGDPCDLLILTRAQMDALVTRGDVVAGSVRDLGRVFTGIGVPASSPVASMGIATPDALRLTLLGAAAIYFPDPIKATAGIHFAGVLDKLRLRIPLADRCKTFPNGATAMRQMVADAANGGVLIGCTQATEILNTPGARLVGLLPPEFELATVYTVGVCARSTSPDVADAFAARLAGEATRSRRAAAGFQACEATGTTSAS